MRAKIARGDALGQAETELLGDDLDAWAEQVRAALPDWLVRDLRTMFEHFQHRGLVATDADLAAVRRALGREPRRFEDFAAELAGQIRRDQPRR